MNRKQSKQGAVMQWYRQLIQTNSFKYQVDKFGTQYEEGHLVDALGSMTEKQLQVVLSFCAGAYAKGCSDTREQLKRLRKNK